MRLLISIILILLLNNISSAQSGWGYVKYTSYKTHNGNGSTNQYPQFANNANDFVNMLNTTNSNTTITHTGQVTLSAMAEGSNTVPRWGNDYFAYKFEFWFVPQETGTYKFAINSDDASDLSVNGTMVTTYYGGHGASAYQIGSINLVAGNSYFIVARMQEFGGGEAFYLRWSRPSATNTLSYWTNEVTNIQQNRRSVKYNFNFININPINFSVNTLNFNNNTWSLNSSNTSTYLNNLGVVDVANSLDTTRLIDGTFKPQSIKFNDLRTDTINAMLDRIVSISDVYLAFKELSDGGGIFGGSGSTHFTSGIQFMNADVDGNNIFDERDSYRLLQHLTGKRSLLDTLQLSSFLKLYDKSIYNEITLSNWKELSNETTSQYYGLNLSDTVLNYNYNVNTTWKGDINMSHSSVQTNIGGAVNMINSISSMMNNNSSTHKPPTSYVISQIENDSLYLTIIMNSNQNKLSGVQFKINYDNSILYYENITYKTNSTPMNFALDRTNYINLGSLITTGEFIDYVEYKLSFSLKRKINNVLGLVSISNTESVDINGQTIKMKVL